MTLATTLLILGAVAIIGYVVLRPFCGGRGYELHGLPIGCDSFPCNIVVAKECKEWAEWRAKNPNAPPIL